VADPNLHKDKFVKNCIREPSAPEDPAALRAKWKPGFFTHTVTKGESLLYIANRYESSGKAPEGFDWKFLSRVNLGVDHPPFVNWKLVETFDFDEAENLTPDKKNYRFKGGEELYVPLKPGASKPGKVAPNLKNKIIKKTVEVATVKGPCLVTKGIASTFKVTGYTVPKTDVTETQRKGVKWKIVDLDDGNSETESTETGETVKLKFDGFALGHRLRVHPYIVKAQALVYCELRRIEVKFEHEIAIPKLDGGVAKHGDPINHIHNPATVVIGGSAKDTAARFKLTEVKPGAPFVLAPNDPCFEWRLKKGTPGTAKFIKVAGKLDNTGAECRLDGVTAGLIVLEGWTAEAEKPCVKMTLQVVNERTIPYRVNFFTDVSGHATTYTAAKTVKIFKVTNIVLRQFGVKLVPDSDTSAGKKYGTEAIAAIAGKAGHFNVTNVADQYCETISFPNAVLASIINGRPGVVSFNFAVSGDSATTLGIAPTALCNIYSRPTEHPNPGVFSNSVKDGLKGPDETIDPTDTAHFKDIKTFNTPDAKPGEQDYGGVLVYKGPPSDNDIQIMAKGQVMAHELGHVVSLKHRGDLTNTGAWGSTPSGSGDDGLNRTTRANLMDPGTSPGVSQTDVDLLQATLFRTNVLTKASPGGLTLKVLYGAKLVGGKLTKLTSVKGKKNAVVKVSVEASRKTSRVANVLMNFWLRPYKTADIRIDEIKDWAPATRKASKGLVTLKIKLLGNAGKKAKVLVMAADGDDVVTAEIACEVTS